LRFVIGLSILQTLIIAFLAIRIMEFDARLKATESAPPSIESLSAIASVPSAPASAIFAEAAPISPDAEIFRRIVREELSALRLTERPAAAQEIAPPANPRDVAAARRELDLYISRGRIERGEVESYLGAIAKLPSAERTEALRALTKAMNDGRLEGHL